MSIRTSDIVSHYHANTLPSELRGHCFDQYCNVAHQGVVFNTL